MTSIRSLVDTLNIPQLLEELADYIQTTKIYYRGNVINPKNSIYFRGVDQFLREHDVYNKQLSKLMSDFPHKNLDDIEELCPKFSKIFKKAIQAKRNKQQQEDQKTEKRIFDFLENESLDVSSSENNLSPEEDYAEKMLKIAVQHKAKSFRLGDCEITF